MASRDLRDAELQPTADASPLLTPEVSVQKTTVLLVLDDFEAAKTARTTRDYGKTAKGDTLTFDTWLKELKDLYFSRRLPKTLPWKFCSNRSLAIAMAILEVLHARIFPAVYNEELTRWRPTEFTDVEKAERIEKFMFWWMRVHAKSREFFDRWTRYTIGFGSTLTVTSWEVQMRDKGETQAAPPAPDTTSLVPASPPQRVFDAFETSRSDIVPLEDVFFQPGATDIQKDTLLLRRHYLYRDLVEMEGNGQVVNVTQPSVLGQQTLKTLLPVTSVAAMGATPEEQEELSDIKRRNQPVDCLEWWGALDLDGDGTPEPVRVLISEKYQLYLGAIPLHVLSRKGLRPIDLTFFLPRLDEPSGCLGLGALEQVKELALEIDAIFNQLTDANSISILKPGFYRSGGDLDPSAMSLAPNRWVATAGNPQQDVYVPDFSIRTEPLILAIRLVLEFIERLTAASAYIMGKESEAVGGSGTATRTEAIVGASNQRHAIPVMRLREGAARILSTHLDLIQLRAEQPDGFLAFMEKRVLGERGEPIFAPNELAMDGLEGEYDAYLLPDESLGSKESERQLSTMLYQIAMTSPVVVSDPTKQYKALADVYKAYGKDPEQYLGIAPDIKQTDRPEDENTMILQGDLASVQASMLDNHIEHILVHTQLLQSPVMAALPPEMQQPIVQFVQAHIQQHMQLMQLMMTLAAKQKAGGGTNTNATASNGGGGARKAGGAPSVGPEPGVGSVQHPRAQAGAIQRTGESQGASGGAF